MGKSNCAQTVARLQAATRARESGLSCPQAILAVYQKELGGRYQSAVELSEKLPEILGEPDLCDVFAVTFAVIARLTGVEDGYKEAIGRMRKEYGGSGCGSGGEETNLCTLRMKDCVLMIEWALCGHGGA